MAKTIMPYEVHIDFEEASGAWLQNKVKSKGCVYSYICGHITKQGTRCMNKPLKALHTSYCYVHSKLKITPASNVLEKTQKRTKK